MTDSKGSERKKKHVKSKLIAASQEKKLQSWKEHFKNVPGNPCELSDKDTEKI